MNTVIFDVGNVLVGYDWESYLRSFHYSEEIYQRIADAVFLNEDWLEGDILSKTHRTWNHRFGRYSQDLREPSCLGP